MRFMDLTGKRFGRLTVISQAQNNENNKVCWLCRCDCGKETVKIGSLLKTGRTKSCGCLIRETTIIRSTKHGYTITHPQLIKARQNIINRCTNKNRVDYQYYGGRGIKVCSEWLDRKTGAKAFCEWALAHGYKEGLTIDRIDVNGDYCPQNCRWVTMAVQCTNRRPKANKTGFPGVTRLESGNYQATITISGKTISFGTFKTAEQAGKAYHTAKAKRDNISLLRGA